MKSNAGLAFALPALIVLFMLIAYPVTYTGWLSVTNDQGQFTGLAKLRRCAAPARDHAGSLEHALVGRAARSSFRCCWALRRRSCSTRISRPRARALGHPHPLGDPGDRRGHDLGLDVPHRVRDHQLHADQRRRIDEPVGWLTARNTVMPAMIAINVWKLFPFVAIMVLAGLQSIPQELYEAARMDGANYWDEVRHIMLPQIRPVIIGRHACCW